VTRILVLEHDPTDPLLRMGAWLADAGATVEVLKLHEGTPVPADLTGYQALISLGSEVGAYDDEAAPWLPAVRELLAQAVENQIPTLGICLGSQLLAVAMGGTVTKGSNGPEIGAYLTAKRDAAQNDPLFDALPMTPDVMQYHYDVVSVLPVGAVLLLSSTGYPNQAWRIGSAAWGLQFHIEPAAADLRAWGSAEGKAAIGRLGPMLDQAEQTMGEVWREFVFRFVRFAGNGNNLDQALRHRLLPLDSS